MSRKGRIAAGTLAKRGRRGGSSVYREFDIFMYCVVVGHRSPWKFARARGGSWRSPKTAGVVLTKKKARRSGSQTTEQKGEEKRERVDTILCEVKGKG